MTADFGRERGIVELVNPMVDQPIVVYEISIGTPGILARNSDNPILGPGKPPTHHRVAIYRIVWPCRDSLGTIYRRLMKCLVLRLRAVARSVFTVAIPLINWLNLADSARRDRYTGCIKRDVYAPGQTMEILSSGESRVNSSVAYIFHSVIPSV